jgi:hypothetical protein
MPIEFICSECNQNLRVPDSAQGKQARCPKCGAVLTVPGAPAGSELPSTAAEKPDAHTPPAGGTVSGPHGDRPAADFSDPDFFGTRSFDDNPFAQQPLGEVPDPRNPFADAGPADSDWSNPYSPPKSKAAALDQVGAVEATDVLGYAWDVWKANLGLVVGVFVFISVVGWMFEGLQNGIQFALVQGGMGEDEAALAMLPLALVRGLVQFYLGIGATLIGLRLARGQSAEFSDVFSGGSLFLPALGASILFGLAVTTGLVLLIIPGVLVALLFWPYYYLIVERKAGVIDAFSVAYQMASQNVGTTFLLALATTGITLLGFLALCVGLFLAIPLTQLVWVVAYMMYSGQLSPRAAYPPR